MSMGKQVDRIVVYLKLIVQVTERTYLIVNDRFFEESNDCNAPPMQPEFRSVVGLSWLLERRPYLS